MMEYSSNLHHQHLEEFHCSSSSAATPSLYSNQDLLLADHFIASTNGAHDSSPREFVRLSHDMPMVQELGLFQWGTTTTAAADEEEEGHNKEELPEPFAKRREISLQNYQANRAIRDLGFVDPLSSLGSTGRGRFGTVLPTANISGPDRLQASCSNYSLGRDARATDLLAPARFGRELRRSTVDNMAMLKEDLAYVQPASNRQSKVSPSVSGGTADQRARRANDKRLEYKSSQSVAKKPRLESRPSFSPFKVRKEKLGDRIAALQQLVAPFGKADTASVLMEAIGYIKFLQDQIETLSVPYMRSLNTKKMRTSEETSNEERDEQKMDLRSRGLCLVSLSCTSYVTNANGGVWTPPNYG
ncbi:transcription factor bHLH110 [Iris pallida]|uniref:Transcription factor bHLH110 n=1 Tax=Iris pallida TaxID=29817 RepID=A0AAX6F2G9_IRIPA|nr:transcription factor bHLH110 [Iris pallida]